jgi:hypothetical protein
MRQKRHDTLQLPIASKPGMPGLRLDDRQRVWVPIGINVVAKNGGNEFFFPQFVRRREWEMDVRAGGRRTTSSIRTKLCECSRCEFFIGRGYLETEVYLRPLLGQETITWKIVCGGCAEELHLSFGFCLVGHADWSDSHARSIRSSWHLAMPLKIRQLEETLISAWNSAEFRTMQRYREKHQTLKGFPRVALWERFIALQQPEVMTFNLLFTELRHISRKVA